MDYRSSPAITPDKSDDVEDMRNCHKNQRSENNIHNSRIRPKKRCWICNNSGHLARDCWNGLRSMGPVNNYKNVRSKQHSSPLYYACDFYANENTTVGRYGHGNFTSDDRRDHTY